MQSTTALCSAVLSLAVLTAGAAAEHRPDADIKSAIEDSYTFKNNLAGDGVKVAVRDGVVTLSGTVSEPYHRTLAAETAEAQHGVKSVDDP
ncbi:MAG: BON domain-containing protein [Elusimicrobia bacterium]|nr:BON domain-containing protein [Elusimicrobiota bacterium]